MKRLKKFNESRENSLDPIKLQIVDILKDSFGDADIPLKIKFTPAEVRNDSIIQRQLIVIEIGSASNDLKSSEYFSLKDKWDDIIRLSEWAKTENLIVEEFIIYSVINDYDNTRINSSIIVKDLQQFNPHKNKYFKTGQEKYGLIAIKLQNANWQTSHRLNYGTDIENQLIQEYQFQNMPQLTQFISKSMEVFESQNHHPNYFKWKDNKILISLKTHSSDNITSKDWQIASQLDTLI